MNSRHMGAIQLLPTELVNPPPTSLSVLIYSKVKLIINFQIQNSILPGRERKEEKGILCFLHLFENNYKYGINIGTTF